MLEHIPKLRFCCKGDLNRSPHSSVQKVGRKICKTIPVLSIFAFLGIITYSTIVIGFGKVNNEVQAAEITGNNAALIIDNGTATDSTATSRGEVTYSSHTVQVKAENITGYALSITGPASITNGTTTLTGAEGATGSNMVANTWGYGWNTTSTTNENMAYNSFTGSAQTLAGVNVSNYKINFTRKLVFAAKFANNAESGHYRANVKLNLTITPQTLVTYTIVYNANNGVNAPSMQAALAPDSGTTLFAHDGSGMTRSGYAFAGWDTSPSATSAAYMPGAPIEFTADSPTKTLYAIWKNTAFPSSLTTMQGMTANICRDVGIGVSKSLTDNGRGGTSYMVQKLKDGNCWMVENLKLNIRNYTLNSTYSDVPSNWSGTNATNVTTESNWSSANTAIQYSTDGFGAPIYNTDYGYYYSWCAATAGTCKNSSGTILDGEASGSICPKGWHLPKGGTSVATTPNRNVTDITTMTSNDFAYLRNLETGLTGTSDSSWPSDKIFAGPPAYFALGGASWYLAGNVYSGRFLVTPGSGADYWSRTSIGSAGSGADSLSVSSNSGRIYPVGGLSRYVGGSVRCIAYSS